ncbi:hypothetical protein NA57DRAFT_60675 [Rhizodiscina lignyota]|uniref:Uncharacterized protein n=1 Tax=Rhizodiscina lignyota TaxID=1504668 RepID=A0A9P4I8I3_9PEZI|nr:hypothetical protein NA57DRAFT_60675 [Rhizodiscina lignyota]
MSSGAIATFNGGCFGVVTFFYVVAVWRRWTTEARLRSSVDSIGVPQLARLGARLPWSDRFLFAAYVCAPALLPIPARKTLTFRSTQLLYAAHFVLLDIAVHKDGVPSEGISKCANFATAFFLVRLISHANEHQQLVNFFVVYNLLAAVLAGFLIAYSCSPSDVYRDDGPNTCPNRWYFWLIAVIPNAIFDLTIFTWFLPKKVVSRVAPGRGRVVTFSFLPKIAIWPVYVVYTYYTWKASYGMIASICAQIGMATITIGATIFPACQRFFDEFKTAGIVVIGPESDAPRPGSTRAGGKGKVTTQESCEPVDASLKSTSSRDPILEPEPIEPIRPADHEWFMKSRHEIRSSKKQAGRQHGFFNERPASHFTPPRHVGWLQHDAHRRRRVSKEIQATCVPAGFQNRTTRRSPASCHSQLLPLRKIIHSQAPSAAELGIYTARIADTIVMGQITRILDEIYHVYGYFRELGIADVKSYLR